MRVSCTQENLNKGLNVVSHIASRNPSLPILNHILLRAEAGGLKLSATNLEIGVSCQIRGKVEEEGVFTVPARLLADFVSLLPQERVDLNLEGENLVVSCQNYKTKIKGLGPEEFPLIPTVEKNEAIVCPVGDFKKALQQVVFAAAADETRPEISGIFLQCQDNGMTLAATDSYRLAEKKIKLSKNVKSQSIIVPAKTLQEVSRTLGEEGESEQIEFYLSANQVLFVYNHVELVSRLIEGQYPDYQQIIPKDFKTEAVIEKRSFANMIKSTSLFCRPGINDLNLALDPKKQEIGISSANTQVGESHCRAKAEIKGQANEIIFNYRYLLDGLANIDDEEVSLSLSSSTTPALLRSKIDKDYLYLVMPIRQ